MSSSHDSLDSKICNNDNEDKYDEFSEGKASIKVPKGAKVFYNPVQEFNRDLSISVLQVAAQYHAKGRDSNASGENKFRVLEAFSASGLRSIRYAKEVPYVTEIVANDISDTAIDIINRNIEYNDVGSVVRSSHSDAAEVMFNHRHRNTKFQVVDLDPYGCPTPFLDSAVQCVEDGGFLLVTCTDMAVLCGNSPETCFVKYGAVSLKIKSCHEMALRIALHSIQSHASKYKKYIEPVISVSVDFYIRVIVRIFTSASKCKEITSKLAMVYHCTGCGTTNLQPLGILNHKNDSERSVVSYHLSHAPTVKPTCQFCRGKHHMGGPIWSGPLHDANFVGEVINVIEMGNLSTKNRLLGVLHMIQEELHDIPLYYNLPKLCSVFKCHAVPMMTFRSAILNGGYRVSFSHASKESFKTDAPMNFIWNIILEWIKANPEQQRNHSDGSVPKNILNALSETKIDLSLRPDANPLSRKNKLLRYQQNPTPFWGPGSRSSSNAEKPIKKIRNQNKKKRKASGVADKDRNKKANTATEA